MFTYIFVYIHICLDTYLFTYIFFYIHFCLHTYLFTYIFVYTFLSTHIFVYTHFCLHTFLSTHICLLQVMRAVLYGDINALIVYLHPGCVRTLGCVLNPPPKKTMQDIENVSTFAVLVTYIWVYYTYNIRN